MYLQSVIEILNQHRTHLAGFGVDSLSVFGSTARGDARQGSDVDLAARITRRPFTLADLVRLELELETILGVDVDLVTEPAAKPRIQSQIDKDRVIAF